MIERERPRVLLHLPAANALPGLEPRHLDRLRKEIPDVDWLMCRDDGEFLRELPGARAVVVWRFKADWLAEARRLALVSTPAAGREWIEVSSGRGLAVAFGSFHGALIAETVLGLLLAFDRGIRDSLDRRARKEIWPRVEVAAGMRTLRGRLAVIVGFGHVGKGIGRLLKGVGMRVVGVNRNDLARPDYFEGGDRVLPIGELDGVLPEADHLIAALPGARDTDNVIDARRLALLRPDACVHNVGRGNAIDLPALTAALRAGALRGAGLDVFPEEPLLSDAPIRDCPNVVLMPHVSAFAPVYIDLYLEELLPLIRMHVTEAATDMEGTRSAGGAADASAGIAP